MAAVSAASSSDTGWCFPERWTSGDLSDQQREDPHLSPIMAWMEQGAERPPWSEFQGASQAVRSLWSQWDQLEQRVPDHQPELSQYVRELRESLEEAYEHARENLQASQQRQKAYYDQRATGTPFQVGDLVWLWVKEIKKGQTRKLKTPWEGPYVVLQRLSDVTYRIQLKDGHGRKQVVHYNRLRLCVIQ